MRQKNRGAINWLTCIGVFLAGMCLGSLLLCLLATQARRPLYIGRAKLMARFPSGVASASDIAQLDRLCSRFQKKFTRPSRRSRDPRELDVTMVIERIPNSEIIMVEAISPLRDDADTAATYKALQLQAAYAMTARPSAGGKTGASSLAMIEDTHVFPANAGPLARYGVPLGFLGAGVSFLLLIILIVAGVLDQRAARRAR